MDRQRKTTHDAGVGRRAYMRVYDGPSHLKRFVCEVQWYRKAHVY
jgi:hypothetical protein